jgi:thymidylate synthase (FAD)
MDKKWIKVQVPADLEIENMNNVQLSYTNLDDKLETTSADVWTPQYRNVLDHGFVGLQDFMGSDGSVVNAARTSYGGGTKTKRTDEGLIRYLMRLQHTTPFEMLEFIFHVKAPIFVFRQWHRHRTASINEMSARYSVLDNEMYIPSSEDAAPQAVDNKQGRNGKLSTNNYNAVYTAYNEAFELSYDTYRYLLQDEEGTVPPPEPIMKRKLFLDDACLQSIKRAQSNNPDHVWTDEEIEEKLEEWYITNELAVADKNFGGIARELARNVLPVSTYSQMYWKVNGKNFLHFISLRYDSHAQKEIRVYAEQMIQLVEPLCPWVIKAFMDYQFEGTRLSKQEINVLQRMYKTMAETTNDVDSWIASVLKEGGASEREVTEFLNKAKL